MGTTSIIKTSPSGQYLLRRVVTKGVVMAALHPAIGPLYWSFVDNSGCNAQDAYRLVEYANFATTFGNSYDVHGEVHGLRGRFMDRFLSSSMKYAKLPSALDEDGVVVYDGMLERLAKKAGTTSAKFYEWVEKAEWVEFPAPVKVFFLKDLNGFSGYRAEWTANTSEALSFSEIEISGGDPDAEIAQTLGEFIPVESAFSELPSNTEESTINHALEAHVERTLHHLGIGRKWFDHLACAKANAAHAGRMSVKDGIEGHVSTHIASFPELLSAFKMGAALEIHKQTVQSIVGTTA